MNRKPLLLHRFQTRWLNTVFGLALISLTLPAFADQSARVSISDGVVSGTLPETKHKFPIVVADTEVATLSPHKDQTWVYWNQRLQAYDSDGSQLINQHHPDLPANHSSIDLSVGYNSVWLAIGRYLFQFDQQGKLIQKRAFRTNIHAIHFDIKQSQILVTTPSYVFILNSEGRVLKRIRTHLPNIA